MKQDYEPSVLREVGERHGTWYAYDVPYKRLQLFSPWTIIGFGLAVGIGLVLVFPHQTLEERLGSTKKNVTSDRLTIEYLKVFLKAEPNAVVLRSALIEQLVRLGSYKEARDAMKGMLNSPNPVVRLDAQWLELQMREQEAFAAPERSLERLRLMEVVRAQMRLLLAIPQDSSHVLMLGRKALAAGDAPLALDAFQLLAARPENLDSATYAEAALATLGLGNYVTSSELYFRAMQHARGIDQRRDFYIRALKTLQAGALYDRIIPAADSHLGILANDTKTMLFLARLAQSANKLDAAERYAKSLLRLSLLQRYPLQQQAISVVWQTPADFYGGLNSSDEGVLKLQPIALNVQDGQSREKPALKFDEEAYLLSFNIFLANRNLNDARRVAESAVLQQPDNSAWRKRLAEVNEWNGAPAAALPQWLAYARLTGDEKSWDKVMALAIGLTDPATQLIVVEHKAVTYPNDPIWVDRLVQAYEAAGHPERAASFLHNAIARSDSQGPRRQHELELLAGLTERTGNDAESLATLRQLQKEFGPTSGFALKIADQLYRTGQPALAFDELERAASRAKVGDAVFWRTYAELARLLQNDDAAKKGLRTILASDQQNESDLSNLIMLLEPSQPLAAARLSEFAFARFGNVAYATRALGLRSRVADWGGARDLLATLTPGQLLLLEKNPDFLSLRSSVYQASNDVSAATRDMRAALALRPNDMDIRAGVIWLLIAGRETAALKSALSAWAHDAETNRILWDPFAAALLATNRQAEALHWFRKSGFQRNDYLWLMSYAEALEATSQEDLAWRIRRRVWLDLRQPDVLRKARPEQWISLRDRLASIAPIFMSGDGASRVMQALLRADVTQLMTPIALQEVPRSGKEVLAQIDRTELNGLPESQQALKIEAARTSATPMLSLFAPSNGLRPRDDARLTASVRELVLAYALNNNANDLAGAWFATRFAEQLSKPLFAELSLALQADDRTNLTKLLDDLPDWLPMYDRVEAAQRAGRPALAQTLAFDQLALLPYDEELHLRLTTMTTEQPANFSFDMIQQNQSPLETRTSHVGTSFNLTPGLKMTVDLTDRKYRSIDSSALTNLPKSDREIGLTLRKQLDAGFVALSVNERQAMSSNTGLRMEYNLLLTQAVGVSGSADYRQLANESALLRVGARRTGFSTTIDYAFSRAEYARLGVGAYRYSSMNGGALGSGRVWNIEAGTHLRIEYPNLTLRAYATNSAYRDRGQPDASIASLLPSTIDLVTYRVLPQSDTVVGLSLGIGTVIENRYSRAWRPFAEIGTTYSRTIGSGYNLRAGIAGSVLGQDLMTLRGLRVSGSAAAFQGTQEFGVDYKWFF